MGRETNICLIRSEVRSIAENPCIHVLYCKHRQHPMPKEVTNPKGKHTTVSI